MRDSFRPKIAATLDDVGLLPQNLPESVSRNKLVEELLDRVVERGFLTLGEVRDAISRNQLKEPDCSGPRSFLRGDAALRMNGRLTETLDGVYEPGDFYLRWILRFSHLMFGTAIGRFLTLYFVIPFGGAYVALKGSDHLVELVTRHQVGNARRLGWIGSSFRARLCSLGVFLAMLIHVPALSRHRLAGLEELGRAIRLLLVDSVRRFFALPWVHWIVHSAAARLAINFVVKPLVPTLLFAAFVPLGETAPGRERSA